MIVRLTQRLFAVTLAGFLMLGMGAWPASAHGSNGQPIPDAQQYLSEITGITPATAGISASIDPRGEWIQVTNATDKTLIILGYTREPYLQIGPGGVAENLYSPTLALNRSLFGDLSQLGDGSLPPTWHTTSTSGRTARWHDHRIHWMGTDRPPAVAAHPDVSRLVGNWKVHMELAGKPVDVSGTLTWLALPAVSQSTVNVLIIDGAVFVLAVAVVGVGWLVYRRRRARSVDEESGEPLVGSPLRDLSGPPNPALIDLDPMGRSVVSGHGPAEVAVRGN